MKFNSINEYISSRRIEGTLKDRLCALCGEDGRRLLELLCHLSPSGNTLRDYLALIDDIAARDNSSVAMVLEDQQIQKFLADDSLANRKEKQGLIKQQLELMRYPEKARILGELKDCQKNIVKKYGLRVEFPKDLEGDNLSITLNGRSPEAMREASSSFQALVKGEEIPRMYRLLLGTE
jgi:hypothetical protein